MLLFLFFSIYVTQDGGTNPKARIAALRAITDGGTLHIDRYKEWTIDWALSPNGHYYQNKAPASIIIGIPIFALTDHVERYTGHVRRDAEGRLPPPGYLTHISLVLLVQLLPFSWLVLQISRYLDECGVPPIAQHFFVVSALFGNTAAILMNSYFGHGLSAVLFLAALYSWLRRRWAVTSLCLSWCVLNEYGAVFALPSFVIASLYRERNLAWVKPVSLAALPAIGVWCWYHTVTFGSPFAIPSVYSNPEVIYNVPDRFNLWGTFTFLPYPPFVLALLFGPERGILFTQPWVLVAVAAAPAIGGDRRLRATALFVTLAFAGLLWLNAGFGGWHAGWTIGPRYIAFVIPAVGLMAALAWKRWSRLVHVSLWLGLAVATIFRWFILPWAVVMPIESPWAHAWSLLMKTTTRLAYEQLFVTALAFACAVVAVLMVGRDRRTASGAQNATQPAERSAQ